jgi:hypothetical protein
MGSLWTGNVIRDARGNDEIGSLPVLTSTRGDEALKQLIAFSTARAPCRSTNGQEEYSFRHERLLDQPHYPNRAWRRWWLSCEGHGVSV